VLIAIAGGSGSGKTWLAEKLERALGPRVARLSIDNFYLDRSHLPPSRRARINFDHPRAIDWACLEKALADLLADRSATVPVYDFKTHARLRSRRVPPQPLILLEGLWPLTRRAVRRLAHLSVFLNCPSSLRLRRRIQRDLAARGRTRASVERQFRDSVEPMHVRFVVPQRQHADVIIEGTCGPHLRSLVAKIKELLPGSESRL
jgi:uridine kinase